MHDPRVFPLYVKIKKVNAAVPVSSFYAPIYASLYAGYASSTRKNGTGSTHALISAVSTLAVCAT